MMYRLLSKQTNNGYNNYYIATHPEKVFQGAITINEVSRKADYAYRYKDLCFLEDTLVIDGSPLVKTQSSEAALIHIGLAFISSCASKDWRKGEDKATIFRLPCNTY